MDQQGLQKFFRFNSTSTVRARCNEETGVIVMHAGDTYNFEVVYVTVDGESIEDFEHYKEKEYLIINLIEECDEGQEIEIEVFVQANLRKDMKAKVLDQQFFAGQYLRPSCKGPLPIIVRRWKWSHSLHGYYSV